MGDFVLQREVIFKMYEWMIDWKAVYLTTAIVLISCGVLLAAATCIIVIVLRCLHVL